MHKSIIALGIIAAGLFAGTIPGVAMAQDGTPPPATQPPSAGAPSDPAAPSGSVAAAASLNGGAPALTGFSVFGILGYFSSVGAGARYMLPVPIPSLIHHARIKDSWAVEFGADLLYWSVGNVLGDYHETELIPIGGLMWTVWLTPQFAVYPKAEIGFGINVAGSRYSYVGHSGIYPAGAAGLLYQVSKTVTLRAEAGSTGLRGGVGLFF
jgi:hypothetical protein